MRVRDILEKRAGKLFCVTPETDLREAAVTMVDNAISAMIVRTSDEKLAGILTERDIARHYATEDTVEDGTVSAVMTVDVIACTPDHDLTEIAEIMSESNIRHLPVITKCIPSDIISIRDIVRFHISALQSENWTLRDLIAALD